MLSVGFNRVDAHDLDFPTQFARKINHFCRRFRCCRGPHGVEEQLAIAAIVDVKIGTPACCAFGICHLGRFRGYGIALQKLGCGCLSAV